MTAEKISSLLLTQQMQAVKHTRTHTPSRGTHPHCCYALPFSAVQPFLPSVSFFNAPELMVADGRSRLRSPSSIKSPPNRRELGRGHEEFE